ncbi:MAG: hypothetical protein AABX02_00710 [archaeon]
MSEAPLILDQLYDELNQFKSLPLIPWQNATRTQLLERLKEWHTHTRRSKELLNLLQMEQLKTPALKDVDLREAETHLRKSEEILQRNIEFEKDKNARKIDLTEKITTPAMGAELEARMHRQWLALQRVQEHARIVLRKALGDVSPSRGTEGDLFKLIRTKEEEIQTIKKERDQLKREKYFGPTEKFSLTEMENDLQELLQQFAIEKHAVLDHLTEGKKKLDEYTNHHMHLENKTKKLEHLVHELTKKHVTIASVLKKERDFARKLTLEMESETASMRALYSKELLSLEDTKYGHKKETEERSLHKMALLEKRTTEQEALIKELDSLVREKERQIARMAEKMPKEERSKTEQSIRNKKTPSVQ